MRAIFDQQDGSIVRISEHEEPETTTCPMCDYSVLIKHTVRDPEGVPICDTKDCIEASRVLDLENNAPSEWDRINKHYDNLLTQLK